MNLGLCVKHKFGVVARFDEGGELFLVGVIRCLLGCQKDTYIFFLSNKSENENENEESENRK